MEMKLELSQSMVLSQKMIQSAQILQMSSGELEAYIKELAVENPVVDLEEQYAQRSSDEDIKRKLEWLESTDAQNRVYYSNDYSEDEERDQWNFAVNKGEDLQEYLMSQLMVKDLDAFHLEVLEYMVNCLDSKGYFEENLSDVAARFEIDELQAELLLHLLQTLEPAGICARNLSECLLLQLDRKGENAESVRRSEVSNTESSNEYTEIARKIIIDYLDTLGKNQLHVIARKLKVSLEEVTQACELIKSLNPKPGSYFASRDNLKYITPDVTVVKLANYYEILLNEYMYPRISVNSYYKNLLNDDTSKEAKVYVSDKVRQAEWIMNCISQRNKTMLNVTKCIIDLQEQFFAKGPGYLKPMRLADVADLVGIHESTVSRAVRDKYLQCSWGVYPMNYFFSKGVKASETKGEMTVSDIQDKIKEIIEDENKKKPYSDRIIGEHLESMGIHISRRTVAKYREACGIKDASGRKVF